MILTNLLLIGQYLVQFKTTEDVSKDQKARILVLGLSNMLKVHSEPQQYLIKICDALLKQDDQRLKDIVKLSYKCLFIFIPKHYAIMYDSYWLKSLILHKHIVYFNYLPFFLIVENIL